MVDGAFALRVVIAFVVGGLAVAGFTAMAERYGSRLGGLLLSFPIKVVVSLLMIGLSEGLAFAAATAAAVPAGIGINVAFLAGSALLALRWPIAAALGGGIALWLVSGVVVLALPLGGNLGATVAVWGAAAFVALLLLDRVPGARGDRRVARKAGGFGLAGLLGRAAGAGSVVALSVVLARALGPFAGGLMSVFPSGFLTSLLILLRRHGPEFTAATARVMVAGSAAPATFGVVAALSMPRLGLVLGLVAALAAAAAASSVVGWILGRVDTAARPS